MKGQNGHITSKVIFGYIVLIAMAVYSVAYIYNVVQQVTEEEDPDVQVGRKIYLVTNTLSLLYESEAVGQFVGKGDANFSHFNRSMNKAHENMDSLRALMTDSIQLMKIDTIDLLLERKRWYTKQLVESWKNVSVGHLYTENIQQKIISVQDTIVQEARVRERMEIKQDTVVVPHEKKGFFKRLAEVFSPDNEETQIVVNSTHHVVRDTLMNAYNPTDTIVSVLRSIQDRVATQREEMMDLLLERANKLQYNNTIISRQINQILRTIEEEEMEVSLDRAYRKQELLKQTSHRIARIAILSTIVAFFFIFFISRDIWQSKYYRKQLENAKLLAENLLKSREKLMLTISHDIRAPLSSIIGYIELLLRRHPDERQAYYLENMRGSSDHILSLVNDLLDFQRLESGEMEIHSVPFRVPALFDEIYTSFKPIAESKGLRFVLNLKSEETHRVYMGDPIRIRQIIGNLLSNAIKFTDEGRIVLVVSVEPIEENYQLKVIVSDSGPGIPEEEQEKIFKEFTRLSTTEDVEGFGLGLSITRKLLSLMNGTLSVQSSLGKGSDFTIVLPISIADNQTVINDHPSQNQQEGFTMIPLLNERKVRCLLVDDDPMQLALTEELLKQSRVEVIACTNPHRVCDLLRASAFDIVITDIQMPTMSGYELLNQIRSSRIAGTEILPVVALSASVANEQQHYIEMGFTGFLNKPFTAVQLISLINKLLALHLEAKSSLNFGSLTAFAGEDKEASNTILRTFADETAKSITLLKQSFDCRDREKASQLSHKLIPVFTMLGANSLVQHLRILEKNDDELVESEWNHLMKAVIAQTTSVVEEVQKVGN